MKINGENSNTGEKFETDADDVNEEFVESMSEFDMADDEIKRFIDNLNISADVKSLLYSFTKATIRVGNYIIKIGRKIIDYVCSAFREYPNAGFGLIFGAIVGFLVSSIPVIGVVLGSTFIKVAAALGLIVGLKEDIKDKALARKVAEINASFSPLGAT